MPHCALFNFFRRRLIFLALLAVLGLPGCGGELTEADQLPTQDQYYASWTGPMLDATTVLPGLTEPPETFENQTVRHLVRLSLGGDHVRIKLSNLFGKTPMTFSGVRVALSTGQSAIDARTDRVVLFRGLPSATLAAGAEFLSDPVALPVAARATLAVSFYFSAPTLVASVHALGRQSTYIGAGNQLSMASMAVATATTRQSYYGLTAVETSSTAKTSVVVTFGDSITDGDQSTVDADLRYPDQLDDRLKSASMQRTGVVNEGIAGNRWLNDIFGPNGNGRFERDVLNVKGVTHVIMLMGINDIGFPLVIAPSQNVSAQQITDAIGAAAAKARAKGIKVILATLLPYQGAFYYSAEGEAKRQAVNAYIRNKKDIDGLADFDRAMQDPANPAALNPLYDSGDHLHPNDAGYGVMAAAVDLAGLK